MDGNLPSENLFKHKCNKCQKFGWVGGNYENESQLPITKRLFIIFNGGNLHLLCEKCLPIKGN